MPPSLLTSRAISGTSSRKFSSSLLTSTTCAQSHLAIAGRLRVVVAVEIVNRCESTPFISCTTGASDCPDWYGTEANSHL